MLSFPQPLRDPPRSSRKKPRPVAAARGFVFKYNGITLLHGHFDVESQPKIDNEILRKMIAA